MKSIRFDNNGDTRRKTRRELSASHQKFPPICSIPLLFHVFHNFIIVTKSSLMSSSDVRCQPGGRDDSHSSWPFKFSYARRSQLQHTRRAHQRDIRKFNNWLKKEIFTEDELAMFTSLFHFTFQLRDVRAVAQKFKHVLYPREKGSMNILKGELVLSECWNSKVIKCISCTLIRMGLVGSARPLHIHGDHPSGLVRRWKGQRWRSRVRWSVCDCVDRCNDCDAQLEAAGRKYVRNWEKFSKFWLISSH